MTEHPTPALTVYNADDSGQVVLAWHHPDGTVDALELELSAALNLMHSLLQAIQRYEAHAGLVAEIDDCLGA